MVPKIYRDLYALGYLENAKAGMADMLQLQSALQHIFKCSVI